MHTPSVKHTLTIFESLRDRVPVVVPEELREALHIDILRLRDDHTVTLEEVEQSMINHGKKLWPYIKAFEDMVYTHEKKMGSKWIAQKASPSVRKKYALFCEIGGDYHTICHGAVMDDFDHDERQELAHLLVDLKQDIRAYAVQSVLTEGKSAYHQKVEEYATMIEEINESIETLRKMAHEHREIDADFAEDILGKIKAIEQSISFLGPSIDMHEIRGLHEYYQGRLQEKKLRR